MVFYKFFFCDIYITMQKIVEEILETESEAVQLVEKAKAEAKEIIEQAEATSSEIVRQAKKEAQESLSRRIASEEASARSLHDRMIQEAEEKNREILALDSPEIETMIERIVSYITTPEYMKG